MTTQFFGHFILQRGRVTREQLLDAVALQREVNVLLGTLAIDRGYMTGQDVEHVNRLQLTVDRRFGELAVEEGYLTAQQVDELLATQNQERLLLGEALVQRGYLTVEELAAELEAFHRDQQDVSASLSAIYAGLPDAVVLEVLTDQTLKLMQRLAHETVKAGHCSTSPGDARLRDFALVQSCEGDFLGDYCLSIDAEMVNRLASRVLGEPVSGSGELARDGAAEFVNIIVGNCCIQLDGMGFNITPSAPRVYYNHGDDPFDLVEAIGAGVITTTPLVYAESTADLIIVGR